ncbi:SdpI family protein [Facklamia miroungae]|uniref:SdpI family protein n=1 Tax=Facklamia miroungae TaxID=120956 RepID=UPI002481F540|nr:SdpI family protein [Facklamia miroungae]
MFSKRKLPNKINSLYGYRTKMSMKNKETWQFAHQHSGNVWIKFGLILLLLIIMVMAFV